MTNPFTQADGKSTADEQAEDSLILEHIDFASTDSLIQISLDNGDEDDEDTDDTYENYLSINIISSVNMIN